MDHDKTKNFLHGNGTGCIVWRKNPLEHHIWEVYGNSVFDQQEISWKD